MPLCSYALHNNNAQDSQEEIKGARVDFYVNVTNKGRTWRACQMMSANQCAPENSPRGGRGRRTSKGICNKNLSADRCSKNVALVDPIFDGQHTFCVLFGSQ